MYRPGVHIRFDFGDTFENHRWPDMLSNQKGPVLELDSGVLQQPLVVYRPTVVKSGDEMERPSW
eukprot:scaffold480047_cov51-Prasinocladus_malaysianus.AAC.1